MHQTWIDGMDDGYQMLGYLYFSPDIAQISFGFRMPDISSISVDIAGILFGYQCRYQSPISTSDVQFLCTSSVIHLCGCNRMTDDR